MRIPQGPLWEGAEKDDDEEDFDQLDEALEETFPASDPISPMVPGFD